MTVIANIVFDDELVNHTKVDYVNYYNNVLDGINYDLPTLFVGWKFFKEKYISQFSDESISILDKKIVNNLLYWEFSFKENKSQHISGIDEFLKNIPHYFYNPKYIYTNLDPVMFGISGITELLHILPSKPDVVYNYKNEMLYVLSNNKIIGVDLIMYDYFDFDIVSIINTLQQNSHKIIYDADGLYYQKQYKKFPNFDNLKRYMVVLLSNS